MTLAGCCLISRESLGIRKASSEVELVLLRKYQVEFPDARVAIFLCQPCAGLGSSTRNKGGKLPR